MLEGRASVDAMEYKGQLAMPHASDTCIPHAPKTANPQTPTMAIAAYDTIIFDLGDVLFDWDEPKNVASLAALPKGAMREMMNSTTWYDLDRGLLPAEEAYKVSSFLASTTFVS